MHCKVVSKYYLVSEQVVCHRPDSSVLSESLVTETKLSKSLVLCTIGAKESHLGGGGVTGISMYVPQPMWDTPFENIT